MENSGDQLTYINFNQDASCLAIGTEKGFKVFHTSPFKDGFERTQLGGVSIVELLYKSSIIAVVGSVENKLYPNNKVVIWDDSSSKVVIEILFKTNIKAVKLKKDKMFIVLENKIYIFSLTNYQNLDTIEIFSNPKGLFSISSSENNNVIAFPDKTRGFVNIKSYDKHVLTTVCCHESEIFYISLNSIGNLLATASDKGTSIRIFSTITGQYLKQLRRGREKAEISSICFSDSSKYLACSSDRGTVHIFSLYNVIEKIKDKKEEKEEETKKTNQNNESIKECDEIIENPKSFLSIFKLFIPINYLKSEWSFNQLRIPEFKSICSFGTKKNIIFTVTSNGILYEAKFHKTNDQCVKISENKISLIKSN